jgi:hypothetical protein
MARIMGMYVPAYMTKLYGAALCTLHSEPITNITSTQDTDTLCSIIGILSCIYITPYLTHISGHDSDHIMMHDASFCACCHYIQPLLMILDGY